MTRYLTIEQDITTMKVDCIVNAANERMLGGGGVDGVIHRAAGTNLVEACSLIPEVSKGVRCPTGHVRITPAFKLPCKFVIHTVGPIWTDGKHNEEELLASCYRRSLQLAALHGKSVAIPAISTGIYKFPVEQACQIAVREVKAFIQNDSNLEDIWLVTYRSDEVRRFLDLLSSPSVSDVTEMLRSELGKVLGVVRVSVDAPLGTYLRATAYVAEHTLEVGMRVHDLEGELAEKWPDVQLDVHVRVERRSAKGIDEATRLKSWKT
jgi:O-acetyl-ADP-ribose deacetylase